MQHRFIPKKARNRTSRERWQLALIGLASIYEGIVLTFSLGYLSVDTRAWVLFDVIDD